MKKRAVACKGTFMRGRAYYLLIMITHIIITQDINLIFIFICFLSMEWKTNTSMFNRWYHFGVTVHPEKYTHSSWWPGDARSRGIWSYLWALLWRHNGHDGLSNHQPHECLLNRSFRCKSKKTSKLRVTGLCAGNSPETDEFPAQRASNTEYVSIWWRHHGNDLVIPVYSAYSTRAL